MKRIKLLETKDIVCIVVLMILKILTILFVFDLLFNICSRYIDTFYFLRPSVFKFNLLMGSTNKNVSINLAKYFKFSLDIRKSIQI